MTLLGVWVIQPHKHLCVMSILHAFPLQCYFNFSELLLFFFSIFAIFQGLYLASDILYQNSNRLFTLPYAPDLLGRPSLQLCITKSQIESRISNTIYIKIYRKITKKNIYNNKKINHPHPIELLWWLHLRQMDRAGEVCCWKDLDHVQLTQSTVCTIESHRAVLSHKINLLLV